MDVQMTRIRNAIFEHAEYLHREIMPASVESLFCNELSSFIVGLI